MVAWGDTERVQYKIKKMKCDKVMGQLPKV